MEFILGSIAVVVVVVLVSVVAIYNKIQRLNVKISEAFANIDVALSRRYHILTQLFEVAKGYAKHEKETFLSVVNLRQGLSIQEKSNAAFEIESGYNRVLMLSEGYPDLKADGVFKKLQDAAFDSEDHLQAARRFYNSNVALYNQAIEVFPGNIVARSMNATRKPMFTIEEHEKNNVDLGM